MPTTPPPNSLLSKVALVTGGSHGIGAATVTRLNGSGATVIIVDLASTAHSAQELINSLPCPSRSCFMPADIRDWAELRSVFQSVQQRYQRLDFVVANAGTMEHEPILQDSYDSNGMLEEPAEAYRTIDVNLKGTLNTLKLAIHYLKSSPPDSPRSIVLIASTAGYFDGAGTLAYTASKHGVVGLLRASQTEAEKHNICVNAIAPFFTTTHLTSGISDAWLRAGLEVNTPDTVAESIEATLLSTESGQGLLISGKYIRELERTRLGLLSSWVGDDVAQYMGRAGDFFTTLGGYILPKPRNN
ncbi:short-chain dehydrogenase reductase 2a [Penicillium cataractarum]|uniref:Short-chain dehydrogenase reductase 2a n=1 Tax=Penicillium cataractarum TaxID=2100454 RepID=A0A9W9RCR9_9EURO|nr:short-chain dehydrogenase reductase 2a [Penicillium cataractarum]KAJ5355123.1 short-chain dehydrogenase reductase 2a [Penicillium cataractarum]